MIITNVEKNKFFNYLQSTTEFNDDKRIKFVGTVYNSELLKFIRENAYAYIHGHEVGGTNPSLLEALGSTKVNLLLDVGFNHEVGLNGAEYWTKNEGSLKNLIERTDLISLKQKNELNTNSNNRILNQFDWSIIVKHYEEMFESGELG